MTLRVGDNSIDKDKIAKYLKDINAADADMARSQSAHMTRCKAPRKKIRSVFESVKRSGMNVAAFRALVMEHRGARKNQQRIGNMELDDAADLEIMRAALGMLADTALGRAAIKREKKKADGEKALESLTE
jgi:hypothetical protein